MILMIQLDADKVNVPISVPFKDSHPAHGWPVCNEVNLATLLEVLGAAELGLLTISSGGFVPFSKVVHVHVAPTPPTSKLIGAFCEYPIPKDNTEKQSVIIFFMIYLICVYVCNIESKYLKSIIL